MKAKAIKGLTKEEQAERDKLHIERICSDEQYAAFFFYEKCRPLLSKILWTMFKDDTSYEDIAHDVYLYFREPNKDGILWHKLRIFKYETSLFDWIKTAAVRLLYCPSEEIFNIPEELIQSGIFESVILEMDKMESRTFLYHRYICKKKLREVAEVLEREEQEMAGVSRRAIKDLRKTLSDKFPEHLGLFFTQTRTEDINGNRDAFSLNSSLGTAKETLDKIDAHKYLSMLSNERYKRVLTALFLEDKSPQDLASELNITEQNVYLLKQRSLEQVRDAMILGGEIENLKKYILLIKDNRKRELAEMIFIQREEYDEIIRANGFKKSEFRKLKSDLLKELRTLIFR